MVSNSWSLSCMGRTGVDPGVSGVESRSLPCFWTFLIVSAIAFTWKVLKGLNVKCFWRWWWSKPHRDRVNKICVTFTFLENIFRSGLTLVSSWDCFCHEDSKQIFDNDQIINHWILDFSDLAGFEIFLIYYYFF